MIRTKTLLQPVLVATFAVLSFASTTASAGPPVIALDVTGPFSNPGKQERCQRVAQQQGFIVNPAAPLRVMLILQAGSNRLQITSARRGDVLNVVRPGWGMEDLCRDAMQAASNALAQEHLPPVGAAPPTSQYGGPPAGYVAPPPPANYAQPAPGGPPSFALNVTGSQSNSGKVERCQRVAQRAGVVLNPSAPLRVTLTLLPGVNRLQVDSARRGEVLNTARPGWGMEQLCEDAVRTALNALAHENDPPVMGASAPPGYEQQRPAYNPPPPGYAPPPARPARQPAQMALGPIPPGADLSPGAKAIADRAVAAWSGARFDVALNEFREAARVQADPQFFFDQAVCEQRLGRYTEALSHTQLFLDRAPQSPYRPYAEQLFNELQSATGNE